MVENRTFKNHIDQYDINIGKWRTLLYKTVGMQWYKIRSFKFGIKDHIDSYDIYIGEWRTQDNLNKLVGTVGKIKSFNLGTKNSNDPYDIYIGNEGHF